MGLLPWKTKPRNLLDEEASQRCNSETLPRKQPALIVDDDVYGSDSFLIKAGGSGTVQPSSHSTSLSPPSTAPHRPIYRSASVVVRPTSPLLPPAEPGQPASRQLLPKYKSSAQFCHKVELYKGSISTVYKASCLLTKTEVIIKQYIKAKMSPRSMHKMRREIRLMHMLASHEGVAQILGDFEDGEYHYIIQEYCSGGDLYKRMILQGEFDEHWACTKVIIPLLRVLAYIHTEAHIVHRDIKPENIFLTGSDELKLGDFGLAIKQDEEVPFLRAGTLDYMAPEVLLNRVVDDFSEGPDVAISDLQREGLKPYDEKVDVWAVGILAYELLVGEAPFFHENEKETVKRIQMANDIPFPSRMRMSQWAEFVRSALRKDPRRRPSAAELLLHPWVQQHSVSQLGLLLKSAVAAAAAGGAPMACSTSLALAQGAGAAKAATPGRSAKPVQQGKQQQEQQQVKQQQEQQQVKQQSMELPALVRVEVDAWGATGSPSSADSGSSANPAPTTGRPPGSPKPDTQAEGPAASATGECQSSEQCCVEDAAVGPAVAAPMEASSNDLLVDIHVGVAELRRTRSTVEAAAAHHGLSDHLCRSVCSSGGSTIPGEEPTTRGAAGAAGAAAVSAPGTIPKELTKEKNQWDEEEREEEERDEEEGKEEAEGPQPGETLALSPLAAGQEEELGDALDVFAAFAAQSHAREQQQEGVCVAWRVHPATPRVAQASRSPSSPNTPTTAQAVEQAAVAAAAAAAAELAATCCPGSPARAPAGALALPPVAKPEHYSPIAPRAKSHSLPRSPFTAKSKLSFVGSLPDPSSLLYSPPSGAGGGEPGNSGGSGAMASSPSPTGSTVQGSKVLAAWGAKRLSRLSMATPTSAGAGAQGAGAELGGPGERPAASGGSRSGSIFRGTNGGGGTPAGTQEVVQGKSGSINRLKLYLSRQRAA